MRLRDCDGEIDYACSVIDADQSLDGVSTMRQVVNKGIMFFPLALNVVDSTKTLRKRVERSVLQYLQGKV